MFVRAKKRKNGISSVEIVESKRNGKKVSQNIIRHLGQAYNEEQEKLLKKLGESIIKGIKNERQPLLPGFSPEKIYDRVGGKKEIKDNPELKDLREEQRIIDGIGEVFGKLFTEMGFNRSIRNTPRNNYWNNNLKNCVIARIANPVSKKATADMLERDYGIKIPVDTIYRMMDHLVKREEEIKKYIGNKTLSLFGGDMNIMFFDVTTLYFESILKNEIKDFGYSKDNKFNEVQIVLALATTKEGLPVSYEIFPGNTYEGHTLLKMVDKLKKEYNVKNITLVADRAMFNKVNLKKMEDEKVEYIVAAKLKSLKKEMKKQIVESTDYKVIKVSNELHWAKEFEYEGKRLIISYSSKRAKKDAKNRQKLIERLMKRFKKGKISIKDLVTNNGSKKYIKIEGKSEISINETKIQEDACWDGLHGVITNNKTASASSILSRYRGLWKIEETFRVSKHNLRMRPIFHWIERRIHAHILICFMALYLIRTAEYRIKIQKKLDLSFEQLRQELLHTQSSILVDLDTKIRYVLPSTSTVNQKKIYKAFGLTRKEKPYQL